VKTISTDHIYLRGQYDVLSICVYGYVIEEEKEKSNLNNMNQTSPELDFFSTEVNFFSF
jgi:hypothetical protein